MDASFIIMWVGFLLACYSVVGNDSIQTLGTFLSSNEHRPWYVLWFFAGSILSATLLYSWYSYGGDVSYGRLQRYPFIEDISWPYLLPPLVLLILTRTSIPVSTTFLVLTFFKPRGLQEMTFKSVLGYMLAFGVAILVWQVITRLLDKRFIENPITPKEARTWTIVQWSSTSFLWGQWLIQDFANIYVYLPRSLSGEEMTISLIILLTILGYIFYSRGGAIQKIVKAKINTVDIRSASIIDFIYALILLFFKEFSNVPMSTTWVFLGLLAGREMAIRYMIVQTETKASSTPLLRGIGTAMNIVVLAFIGYIVYLRDQVANEAILIFASVIILRAVIFYFEARQQNRDMGKTYGMIGSDLAKVTLGLTISIGLVYLMQWVTGI